MSIAVLLALVAKSTAMLALMAAAVCDIRRRIIPDELVLTTAIAGFVLRALHFQVGPLMASLGVAIVLLLLMGELARRGIVGGGDAKLIAAASLVLPVSGVPAQLLHIALAGGLVALAYLAKALVQSRQTETAAASTPGTTAPVPLLTKSIPYGAAIMIGTAVSLVLQEASI
jgi:prepilin peptidase CpaA